MITKSTYVKSSLSLVCGKTWLLNQTPEACIVKVVNMTYEKIYS